MASFFHPRNRRRSSFNWSDRAWQEHAAIIDAVESGDVLTAVRLMTEHLDHLEEKLRRANTVSG